VHGDWFHAGAPRRSPLAARRSPLAARIWTLFKEDIQMKMTITRTFEFCAGHRLHRADWSDQKNQEIFGLCANPEGHGHNYTLEVSVSGPIDKTTGMIMNLRQLKEIVATEVISQVDHKNLNKDVPWMASVNPTTEEFAARIGQRLEDLLRRHVPQVKLAALVLRETSNNKVAITWE
jgi:6-pyruvoyltetrahydropterin/6-carboxytetrahydropterin synthase